MPCPFYHRKGIRGNPIGFYPQINGLIRYPAFNRVLLYSHKYKDNNYIYLFNFINLQIILQIIIELIETIHIFTTLKNIYGTGTNPGN